MLSELERLAREAEHEAATSDKCDRWDAFAMAMADSAPLLLAAVRAAEARPWWVVVEERVSGDHIEQCNGCGFGRKQSNPITHEDGCRFAPLDSALAALKGRT